MNYYIDFDNTLYETARLTSLMLKTISASVSLETGKSTEELLEEATNSFDSTNDNIYSFAERMAQKYGVDSGTIIDNLNKVLENGKEFVFDDAKRFLERLKKNGDKCYILTFLPKSNQEYQMRKILGSGIGSYFEGIIMTTEYKFLLDINYRNGIFIDDDPRDLEGLLSKNPIKVIRMKKPSNKRSKVEMNNRKIEEYESFDDIRIIESQER